MVTVADWPWWVWLLVVLYATPGVYCLIGLLRMKPVTLRLPEEGEEPPKPRSPWLNAVLYSLGSILVICLWPTLLYSELRQFHRD
jgi:hypothetical protein